MSGGGSMVEGGAEGQVEIRSEHADGVLVVGVVGEIDMANARLVEADVRAQLLDADVALLDLRATAYMDSAALAAVDRLVREADARGGSLRLLVAPDGAVDRILRVAGLDDLIAG